MLGFYFDRMSRDELYSWAMTSGLTPGRDWSREQLLAGLHQTAASVVAAKMALDEGHVDIKIIPKNDPEALLN